MRYLLVLIVTLYSIITFSQDEGSNFKLNTSWGINDERTVSKVGIKKIFLEEVLAKEITTSDDFKLKVIDTALRTTLQFQQIVKPITDKQLEETPQEELMQFMIENIELRMHGLPYHLLIDRSSGLAFEVVNETIYDENIPEIIAESMRDFQSSMQQSEEGLAEFKEQLANYLQASKKSILESIINQLNELLEPYTYTYPLKGTVEKEVVIDRIGGENEVVGKDVPATLTLTARKDQQELKVETSLTYDKAAFLTYMKRANPVFANVHPEELIVKEKKRFTANTQTNWVEKYTSEMLTEIPDIRIIQFNSYYFND